MRCWIGFLQRLIGVLVQQVLQMLAGGQRLTWMRAMVDVVVVDRGAGARINVRMGCDGCGGG